MHSHLKLWKTILALIQKLEPNYALPSRHALKAMVERKYKDAKEDLEKAECVSITADTWNSMSMESFLGVTHHFIDANLKLSSVLLGVGHFAQSHTAENLRDATEEK